MKQLGFLTKSRGIYKITNTINGRVYIGKTNNFRKRYSQHKSSYRYRNTKHVNEKLMFDYDEFGIDNFTFEEVYYCLVGEDMLYMESVFMRECNSFDSEKGYNLCMNDGDTSTVSSFTSDKISSRLIKEWCNGVRQNHSVKMKVSWLNRDRELQSKLMSKTLTKYYYCLNDNVTIQYTYQDIVNMGFKSVVSAFYKKQSDRVTFKGNIVERFKNET